MFDFMFITVLLEFVLFFCNHCHAFSVFWKEDCVTVFAPYLSSSRWPLLVCKATQGRKLLESLVQPWRSVYLQTGSEGHPAEFFSEEGVPGVNCCVTLGDNSSCRFYCCIFHEHINMPGSFFFFPPLSQWRSWSWRWQRHVSSNLPSPSSQRGHNAEWAGHQSGRDIRFKEALKRHMVATTALFLAEGWVGGAFLAQSYANAVAHRAVWLTASWRRGVAIVIFFFF